MKLPRTGKSFIFAALLIPSMVGLVSPETSNAFTVKEIPLRVIIPSIGIDAVVKESFVVGDTWEVHRKAAGFGMGSNFLNETGGNSVIFAHARKSLFGNLENVQLGEKITVLGQHKIYTYIISEQKQILPNDVDAVMDGDRSALTLFTCDGDFDEQRLVIKAIKIAENDYPIASSKIV